MEGKPDEYRSFSEVGRVLDLNRQTVADVVRMFEIPTYPHPLNGKAKCLDRQGFERVAGIMNRGRYLLTQSA